jgi:uncharacterized protein (UPF0335 family)
MMPTCYAAQVENEEAEAEALAAHERTQRLKAEYAQAVRDEEDVYLRLHDHGFRPAAVARVVKMNRVTVAKMVRLARARRGA